MWIGRDSDGEIWIYERNPIWTYESFQLEDEDGKKILGGRIEAEHINDVVEMLKLEEGDLLEFELIKRNCKTPLEAILDVSDN